VCLDLDKAGPMDGSEVASLVGMCIPLAAFDVRLHPLKLTSADGTTSSPPTELEKMDSLTINFPGLLHSLQTSKSVLALAVSSHSIFVAVEGGEILVGLPDKVR
jgi:hypothetical protein